MHLRKAAPNEAGALTQLALRSTRAWGYDEAFMQRTAEHGIVAEDDGVIVGYAIVRVEEDGTAYLRDLFIEPNRFRNGIGRMLFDAAVTYARDHGGASITLGGDLNAAGFYEKAGMRQIGSEPSIAGGGRMLPVMAMEISPC